MHTIIQSVCKRHLQKVIIGKHFIHWTPENTQPISCTPYRVGPKAQKFEKAKVKKMLLQKISESAQTEWTAPIVFALKKRGSLHFCVDHKSLKTVTKRDSYPIPRTDECFDSLAETAVFSIQDANNGYRKFEVEESNCNKFLSTSHHGQYRFVQLPLNLKNAQRTFPFSIVAILSLVKWQRTLVYLDDIVVFFHSPSDQINDVQQGLSLLKAAGATLML